MKLYLNSVLKIFSTFLISFALLISTVNAEFKYEHNPMDNPKAAADIIVNPDAVYGFSPNPESTRLGVFADAIDWTNAEEVAEAKSQREEYHTKNEEMYTILRDMTNEGYSLEEIARKVSSRRNEIRLESYDNPEDLARVKQSNLETYGNEFGPTADSLYEKYGSWQTVIEKAFSTNAGMDACLGLYDRYYYTYGIKEETTTDDKNDEVTTSIVYEVLEGAGQSITQGQELTFRFNIEYDKFHESGKVYIDDQLVENTQYITKEGSTLLTFNKEYTKLLDAKEHVLRVEVADGKIETKFAILKEISNPQTGDNVLFYISMSGISTIGLTGAGFYVRKKRFN